MQSNGGITSARSARREPIQTLLSGPVGGTIGRCRARPLDRPAQPALHRHGRDVVRPQPGGRRPADRLDRDGVRRPARADAARRHPHDRRGRRLARVARGGRPARRAAERWSRSGPGLLRPRRDPADRHGRQPVPGPARLGLLPRRPDDARRERGRGRARLGRRGGRARYDRARRGDARDRQREDGGRDADDHRASRGSTRASTPSSRSAEPARCTPSGSPRSSRSAR